MVILTYVSTKLSIEQNKKIGLQSCIVKVLHRKCHKVTDYSMLYVIYMHWLSFDLRSDSGTCTYVTILVIDIACIGKDNGSVKSLGSWDLCKKSSERRHDWWYYSIAQWKNPHML